jgi:predicted GNAT superfamily acetyltransferase
MSVALRIVWEQEHLKQIVELQKAVWDAETITSIPQLVAAIHHGGVVIAAFDGEQIIGFCYWFPGFHAGEVYLVSHMAAVHPHYRNLGLGRRLKEKQREWAIAYGYEKMVWTFDPLESRNAYLNLCKLGGYVKKYIPSLYGEMNDSINRGLPSDRFLLEWKLSSARVANALAGKGPEMDAWKQYDTLLSWRMDGIHPRPDVHHPLEGEEGYLIPVPASIHDIKQTDYELARMWRFQIRDQLSKAFSQGYCVVGLLRTDEPVHYYVLSNTAPE